MKTILLSIINNDTSYNKSATRYLYKTHPTLWNEILQVTSFLPESSVPKQRIWHILNDVFDRPVCPITGEFLKWNEKQYLGTSSRRAKQLLKWQNGDYDNMNNPEARERRRVGNLNAVKNGRKYRDKSTYTEIQKEKIKSTFLKKYGVDNPSKAPEIRKKISDIQIEKGATPIHLRSLRRLYYEKVWFWTEQNWKSNFDDINPTRLNRSNNALDHIYSIQQGFRDGIPSYVIGHWTNLRVISLSENSKKGMRCDKSKDQLFEDFFKNQT